MQHDFWETRGDLSRCAFTSATLGGYKSPPGHKGFGSYAAAAKKGATVLRRPEQRVISGFHDGFHSYHGKDEPDLPAYAAAVEGCAVRMLARAAPARLVRSIEGGRGGAAGRERDRPGRRVPDRLGRGAAAGERTGSSRIAAPPRGSAPDRSGRGGAAGE